MSLYWKQSTIMATQGAILGQLFNYFYSQPNSEDRSAWLAKIGSSLQFDPKYIRRAQNRELLVSANGEII